jgi:hypothetical protein
MRDLFDAAGAGRQCAPAELSSGEMVPAELHWYEATGIGRREFKIKGLL